MEEVIDIEQEENTDRSNKFRALMEIVPDADPEYLRNISSNYVFRNEDFEEFVESLIEKGNYPKRHTIKLEPEEEKPVIAAMPFCVESFLKKFPDPLKYFMENKKGPSYKEHSLYYLKKMYRYASVKVINSLMAKKNYNLTLTLKEIRKMGRTRVTRRTIQEITQLEPKIINEDFLTEVAFLENEETIFNYLKSKEKARAEALEQARLAGELLVCGCCYNDELLIDDMMPCNDGHLFCKKCVLRGCEILIGDGKVNFPCLSSCGSEFELDSLKDLLHPASYERVLKKRQEIEVKSAGISGLEFCPFCEYAEIPPEGDRIFRCKSCMKESCRMCKKLSHIPLRCDEAAENEKIKARTFIEDKMTEALIRTCYSCQKKFIREDGCNKMTCVCGAKMCYICREPVRDYGHFQNETELKGNKCPLYTHNNELHVTAVRKAGEEAKNQVIQKHLLVDDEYDPFKGLTPNKKLKSRINHHRRRHLVAGPLQIRNMQDIRQRNRDIYQMRLMNQHRRRGRIGSE